MSSSFTRRLVVTLALVGLAAPPALAASSDTAITISPRTLLAAPARSPVDFPGVPSARAGAALPKGAVVVARTVRIVRGTDAAFAALRMTCPAGKTWRTAATTGQIGATVVDRIVSRKRSVLVLATPDARTTAVGSTASGALYALCR